MADITVQFVRPDRLMFEGPVESVVLITPRGELGVGPGRAPLNCALGDGVVRLNRREEDGGGVRRVIISGGYAEVSNDTVIILADHARLDDDVDPAVVHEMLVEANRMLAELDDDDNRVPYWENRVKWCNLLLKHSVQ
ncbi:MAG: ATP synthase F1 subunit epsilon [Atopobiaceae bacterium]|nr:ATP synthase F1 subunit epsilon [Atopobiaceae bacterium]